jgi:hypothetical protein
MTQGLSERLSKIIEEKRLKEKLEQDFHAIEIELQNQMLRLDTLSTQLNKEKIDVEKLGKASLIYLFYSVLGSREQQLEKERQELLAAQLLYQQVKNQADYLAQEKDRLSTQLEKFAGTDSEYKLLLLEKEKFIQQSNQTIAKELLETSEKLANLNSEMLEITEAIDAGNSVIVDLNQAIKSLESAGNWGTWDIIGGGLITDMIKHSHIDDARIHVTNAQKKISQFKRELADVQQNVDIQINIGDLATFADFFFDGLISDWVVLEKIEGSLERSNKAKSIIVQTIKELETLKESTQREFNKIQEKRVLLIERT